VEKETFKRLVTTKSKRWTPKRGSAQLVRLEGFELPPDSRTFSTQ